MNFYYSKHTTHRPQTNSSHFNEDAHCDNEVNLILEKNYNQQLIEQSIQKEQQQQQQQQQSTVVSQTDQYYFVPIREQSSTMALPANNNSNVPDSSSILLTDLPAPSTENLFDYSTTVMKTNDNYTLTDADLAALFVSSIVSTTPSNTNDEQKDEHSNNNNTNNNNNTLDDVFIQQVNDLVCSSQQQKPLGPPPGFENFRFDTSSSSDNSINTAAIQPTQVSSSDTINLSQLLQTNIIDPQQQQQQQQQLIGGNVRSSSSSHSSFTSDEQSIFYPMSTHHYSSSSSQIFSTNTPASSTITNSNAKTFLPNSLSTTKQTFSSLDISNHSTSPTSTKFIDADQIRTDADATPNHLFTSPNSFFSNGHKDFAPTKPSTTKLSSTNRQSSSSASSSTSSSIDDALIQLSQQQQQQQTANKLFSNDALSIFNFPSSQKTTTTNIDKQQRAVQDNISFLASMAAASTPVTPESPWQQTQFPPQRKPQSMMLQSQTIIPESPSISMQELIENLNEICYRGFDELNALIQEQRWVQTYLNVNSSSPSSPLININGTNCCSSRILIVPEYFIFKCKKIEITASHVYDLLAAGRPELRLRDLMFVFKSWKESITNAELIHQEEEMKLRLTTEHPHSYFMNDTILQAAFDRVVSVIRQLGNMTQQARAAFQYATLNVFQTSSRQQQNQISSNNAQSSNAIALAQLQALQQQKSSSSSSIYRLGGSIHTTP